MKYVAPRRLLIVLSHATHVRASYVARPDLSRRRP